MPGVLSTDLPLRPRHGPALKLIVPTDPQIHCEIIVINFLSKTDISKTASINPWLDQHAHIHTYTNQTKTTTSQLKSC